MPRSELAEIFRSDVSLGRFDPIPFEGTKQCPFELLTQAAIQEPEKKKEGEAEEMEEQEEKKK